MSKDNWAAIETLGRHEKSGPYDCFLPHCGYEELIESCGVTIHLQQDIGSYSGDSLAIVGEGKRIGWLNWGWGSCSGCDALQACDNFQELSEIREGLYDGVRWFDSPSGMLAYWNDKDWAGEWFYYEKDTDGFVERGRAFLEGAAV